MGRRAPSRGVATMPASPRWSSPRARIEHRLRGRLQHVRSGNRVGDADTRSNDTIVLQRGVRMIDARLSDELTEYDGDLSGIEVPRLDDVVSPSRLEAWTACPHAYFDRYLLDVEPVEEPGDEISITARDRGTAHHAALDLFHRAVVDGVLPQPGPDGWTDEHRHALTRFFDQVCERTERRGRTGRPAFWADERSRMLDDLLAWLRHDSDLVMARGSTVLASEMRFGADDAASIELPDGRRIRLKGSVDRVDRTRDGSLVVTDHKSGGKDKFKDMTADDPTVGGTLFQLPSYAAAARARFGDADTTGVRRVRAAPKGRLRPTRVPDEPRGRREGQRGAWRWSLRASRPGSSPTAPSGPAGGSTSAVTTASPTDSAPPNVGPSGNASATTLDSLRGSASTRRPRDGRRPCPPTPARYRPTRPHASGSAPTSTPPCSSRPEQVRARPARWWLASSTSCASGVPITGIAAITFTEKAAAELRSRTRQRLEAHPGPDTDAALARLDHAPIGTLHSFARRILFDFPIEAGLPPGFTVLDELESGLAFEEQWNDLLDELLDDADPAAGLIAGGRAFVELCEFDGFGVDKGARRMADDFRSNWDLVNDRVELSDPGPLDLDLSAHRCSSSTDRRHAVPDDDKQAETVAELVALADGLHSQSLRTRLEALWALDDNYGHWGTERTSFPGAKGKWTKAFGPAAPTRSSRSEPTRSNSAARARRARGRQAAPSAVARCRHRSVRARRGNRTGGDGQLEFHDLLVLARRLLTEHAHIRRLLHERYERVLLDEFQDTDPIQLEIAVRLTSDPDDPAQATSTDPGAPVVARPAAAARAGCSSSATRNSRSTASVEPTSPSTCAPPSRSAPTTSRCRRTSARPAP